MELIKREFLKVLEKYQVEDGPIDVMMKEVGSEIELKTLTPEEAIGNPEHDDYPLLKGKERLMQATFKTGAGVAFVDQYGNFKGKLSDVLNLPLQNNFERGILVATINAVLNHLDLIDRTIHCRDEGPVKCAGQLKYYIYQSYGFPKVFQVGLQPRFTEVLADNFPLVVTDNDSDNWNKKIKGVKVDSPEKTAEYLEWAELIFATGSIFCNGTYHSFLEAQKPIIIYGVTGAGIAHLLGLSRYCREGINFK